MRKWMLVAAALAMLVLGTVAAVGAQSARVPGDAIPACTEEELGVLADVMQPIYTDFRAVTDDLINMTVDNVDDFVQQFHDVQMRWLLEGLSGTPTCAAAYDLSLIFNLMTSEGLVFAMASKVGLEAEAADDDSTSATYAELIAFHGGVMNQLIGIFEETLLQVFPNLAATLEP